MRALLIAMVLVGCIEVPEAMNCDQASEHICETVYDCYQTPWDDQNHQCASDLNALATCESRDKMGDVFAACFDTCDDLVTCTQAALLQVKAK